MRWTRLPMSCAPSGWNTSTPAHRNRRHDRCSRQDRKLQHTSSMYPGACFASLAGGQTLKCSVFACRAPILNGKVLQIAVWLLESVFSGPIWVKSMRDSGIPQAVRDIDLPEPATFQPYWPQPSIDNSSRSETVVEDRSVPECLALASQGIPGDVLPKHSILTARLLSARGPPD